jgi:hypothetical protein
VLIREYHCGVSWEIASGRKTECKRNAEDLPPNAPSAWRDRAFYDAVTYDSV